MKHSISLLLGATLFALVLIGTGCGDDTPGGGGGTTALPPTLSLATDAGFISADANVPFSAPVFNVRINVNDGDNPLNSLTISQDGSTVPFDNLVWDNGNTTSQNPFLIAGSDQSGTSYDVQITTVNPTANSSSSFTFTVTDSENRTAS